jgi:mono/diheme cytochrome c family protein
MKVILKDMKTLMVICIAGFGLTTLLSSCDKSRGNNPGVEYAPDMYYDKGYEPYKELDSNSLNRFGSNMREPVKGSIAVGQLDYFYHLPNSGEGYENAATQVDYPVDFDFDFAKGKRLYGIYCSPCHGSQGNNDGSVFKKVPDIKPAWSGYQDEYIKSLPQGKIYHVLMYGKNNMGSHASVLNPNERWQVIAYVQELSGIGFKGKTALSSSDNTSVDSNESLDN